VKRTLGVLAQQESRQKFAFGTLDPISRAAVFQAAAMLRRPRVEERTGRRGEQQRKALKEGRP
jgi:hypothetical protein